MSTELRLAGLTEVAEILGVSKRTATRYVARRDFPTPVAHLAMGPVWLAEEVEAWARELPVRRGRPPSRGSRRG